MTEKWRPRCYSATRDSSVPSTQPLSQCEAEPCMHQRTLLERAAYSKAVSIITDIITPDEKKELKDEISWCCMWGGLAITLSMQFCG